ncbi:glycoside hydrolase family 57 protein [Candidatus Dojkabacteria bacterium]|uniref:Glycoside hydrolase family 57 protein n=1 Tax=Candidatus Dojkabacteria bacterium TaxID=2099670 RepID=A0A955L501_9BACT|nr:glycoside hydrolase family 57 protein [Candidatus Dojkabacteria bacterium]
MKSKKYNKTICFYFQVHQPFRLTKFNYFDLETKKDYFEGSKDKLNKEIVKKVGEKCYLPTNKLLLKLIKKHPEFNISFSISGVTLEQFELYWPEVLDSFKALVDTKRVEIINETYYHSLSWLYSKEEFAEQVMKHRNKIWKIFKRRPKVFRNTELIYNNELGNFIRELGFDAILAEGWDYYLDGRNPNYIYESPDFMMHEEDYKVIQKYKLKDKPNDKIGLLLKNYKLSDDIAFRFSNKEWKEHPLTVEKFADWVENTEGDTINLFMDYETFGEHQWEDSGIFRFLEKLPEALLKRNIGFKTPSQTIDTYETQGKLDMHSLVSWADMERDVSAWLGNKMQKESAKQVYECEGVLKQLKGKLKNKRLTDKLMDTWRRLQTSDHFYYMCTKYWNDGDVHKYFSHYESPYDAYINYMNVLSDFKTELVKMSQVSA